MDARREKLHDLEQAQEHIRVLRKLHKKYPHVLPEISVEVLLRVKAVVRDLRAANRTR